MKMNYIRFPVSCDLTTGTLADAAQQLIDMGGGRVAVFNLHISPSVLVYVRSMVKHIQADTRDNPLAPYINLITETGFERDEWCLSDGALAVGSEGA